MGRLIDADEAISIVDEVAQKFEEKYLIVPKDDFTEDLLNMGYTKGIKDGYNKAIDNFFDNLQEYETEDGWLRLKMSSIYEISEHLKEGIQ